MAQIEIGRISVTIFLLLYLELFLDYYSYFMCRATFSLQSQTTTNADVRDDVGFYVSKES
jgi:hypothetical protein